MAEHPQGLMVWVCPVCGDFAECEPGEECEVCAEGTIGIVEYVPLAALQASEERVGQLEAAIQLADDFLTTAQGGDIVRGEACKHHVREILRSALAAPSEEPQ